MKSTTRLAFFCGALLLANSVSADVTNTTPYDYEHPPKPGKEGGTYMAAASGAFGPDCFFTFIGTAKYLPNKDGSGGQHCTKGNVELSGTGPLCALKAEADPALIVLKGTYTYNGDGTLCESQQLVGGQLDGTQFPFHTYVDTGGRWLYVTTQDISYACPTAPPNFPGLTTQGPGFKISRHGDDPPGSGELPCTNP